MASGRPSFNEQEALPFVPNEELLQELPLVYGRTSARPSFDFQRSFTSEAGRSSFTSEGGRSVTAEHDYVLSSGAAASSSFCTTLHGASSSAPQSFSYDADAEFFEENRAGARTRCGGPMFGPRSNIFLGEEAGLFGGEWADAGPRRDDSASLCSPSPTEWEGLTTWFPKKQVRR